jgi:hypothetical protein
VRANFQYSELDFASEDRTEGILGIVFGSTTRDAGCDKGIEGFGDQVKDRVSAAGEPAAKLTFLRELNPNVVLTLQKLASGCNSAQRFADTNGKGYCSAVPGVCPLPSLSRAIPKTETRSACVPQ